MRDSGVEWIGEIPAHWEIRRSKFVFTQRKELAKPGDVQLSATQAYGVIPQDEYESKIDRRVVKIQFHLEKRKHVEIDDFVISMRSFQGGLERAWSEGCIRSSYVVLRPLIKLNASYYGYLFKSSRYISALQSTANFIRDGQDLNFENFSMVDLPIAPLEEQCKIADYLDYRICLLNKSTELLQQQIDKLKEYKTTLINSAVTGKIRVPEVVV
jgi:type I restriction enzyme S subunit